ncbi:MAG: hypothetical protein IJ856_07355, partial [Candidatus Methanomethylophilaceae archaeon]|nr:hypothetical protein [Candidatus Methanomethylophilaceae archaeon]
MLATERPRSERDLYSIAYNLPSEIMSHKAFDIKYENENWHGEDNGTCYREVVGNFVERAIRSRYPIFDVLDVTCEACLTNTVFDASYAVEIISSLIGNYRKRISVKE